MNWTDILTASFIIQILASGVRLSTPLILAALGEIFAERSGVMNLGIEGIMLLGSFIGFSVAILTGNLWAGVGASILLGALMGLLFAFMSVTLNANQIIIGLSLLIFCTGAAVYFYRLQFSFSLLPPSIDIFETLSIPLLSQIPILGPIFFDHTIFTYMMFLAIPISTFVLYRTPFGLRIKAVGEYPQAADTVGVNVAFIRYSCVIIGGILAALGGAYFSLAEIGIYADTLIGGRGFIALALVVFGRWNPVWALAGGLVFGIVDALQTRLQFLLSEVPSNFLIMMPYVLTILILLIGRNKQAPSAINIPFIRE